jgi:hypothetical protein
VEASSGFGPAGRNGGEAAEAQIGVVGVGVQGEARGGIGPARPDHGTALMAQAHAWRALPRLAERGAACGARWSGGSDRWASAWESAASRWVPCVSDFPISENLKNHLSTQEK